MALFPVCPSTGGVASLHVSNWLELCVSTGDSVNFSGVMFMEMKSFMSVKSWSAALYRVSHTLYCEWEGLDGDESTALMSLRERASHPSHVERIFLSRRVARLQVCTELENLRESRHWSKWPQHILGIYLFISFFALNINTCSCGLAADRTRWCSVCQVFFMRKTGRSFFLLIIQTALTDSSFKCTVCV